MQDSAATSHVGSPEFVLAALGAWITAAPQDPVEDVDLNTAEATQPAGEEVPVVERRVTRSMTRLSRESASPADIAEAGSSTAGSTRSRKRSAGQNSSTPTGKRAKRSS